MHPHEHRVYTVQTCRPVPASPREVEPTGERTYRDPSTGMEYEVLWNGGPLLDPRASRPQGEPGQTRGRRHSGDRR